MKKWGLILFSFILVGLTVFITLKQKNITHIFYSTFGVTIPSQVKLLGIDVSHHQGNINWDEVEGMKINGDTIQFVYLKVTEGTLHKDRKYKTNRKALDSKALKVGVYHFFSPNKDIIKQVQHFTTSFKKTTLKPVLDIETIGDLTKKEVIAAVILFINETEKRINVRPIIYTYSSFYKDYFKNTVLESELFWIANYGSTCKICDQDNVIAWQFSEKGTINGITEKVDLNSAKTNFWDNAIWK
jgi:lysozyme